MDLLAETPTGASSMIDRMLVPGHRFVMSLAQSGIEVWAPHSVGVPAVKSGPEAEKQGEF
jgi:hypothetical protein